MLAADIGLSLVTRCGEPRGAHAWVQDRRSARGVVPILGPMELRNCSWAPARPMSISLAASPLPNAGTSVIPPIRWPAPDRHEAAGSRRARIGGPSRPASSSPCWAHREYERAPPRARRFRSPAWRWPLGEARREDDLGGDRVSGRDEPIGMTVRSQFGDRRHRRTPGHRRSGRRAGASPSYSPAARGRVARHAAAARSGPLGQSGRRGPKRYPSRSGQVALGLRSRMSGWTVGGGRPVAGRPHESDGAGLDREDRDGPVEHSLRAVG